MKSLFLSLILLLLGVTVWSNDHPPQSIEKRTKSGEIIQVETILIGKISYYKRVLPSLALPFEEAYPDYSQARVEYYVARKNDAYITQIRSKNYVELLKPMLVGNPKLFRRLGRRGYTFSELYHIIEEYNRK